MGKMQLAHSVIPVMKGKVMSFGLIAEFEILYHHRRDQCWLVIPSFDTGSTQSEIVERVKVIDILT
jgi:hypothetical protein